VTHPWELGIPDFAEAQIAAVLAGAGEIGRNLRG